MKAEIQERLNKKIERLTIYNTLFSDIIEAVEVSCNCSMVRESDNTYTCASPANSAYTYIVVCSDADYQAVSVSVINTGDNNSVVASSYVNVPATKSERVEVFESLFNIPRAVRREVSNCFGYIYDAVEDYNDANVTAG
jgi:hypothetical protein